MMCENGTVYKPCGDPCHMTCADLANSDGRCEERPCTEGCYCPDGYVKQGKIHPRNPGLTLSSIYTRFNTLKTKHLGKHCGKM